ncbi:MAG: hypothetical protein LUH10_07450 [Tannerellaceae bacterium]|nr:hypothetical protein [Tannerellaceae bacterium]
MEIHVKKLYCTNIRQYNKSKRTTPFNYVVYSFNYKTSTSDKSVIDNLLEKAKRLANSVYTGAANDGTYKRNNSRILNNCIAGVLSEYCWKHYLNLETEIVTETPFNSANNQIDLQVISNSKTIEVRSSFPRNGISFAICHPIYQFDIIGPYDTYYKPGEIKKNYYIRTLYPFTSNLIENKFKQDGFEVYLTGGATWEMMMNPLIGINKNFIPDDELDPKRIETKSNYKVVPYCKALDTIEIKNEIKK